MKPPKRRGSGVVKKVEEPTSFREKWTLDEKKDLLGALKRFGSEDTHILQQAVRTKTTRQIELFIRGKRLVSKHPPGGTPQVPIEGAPEKSPIELWLEMIRNLTQHTTDYSFATAQVVSVIGHLEQYEGPACTTDPNYPAIYRHIAALLANKTPPPLSPINSAVLLDVLQNLADRLRALDRSSQRKLMQLKYQMLLQGERKKADTLRIALDDPLKFVGLVAPNSPRSRKVPSASTSRVPSSEAGVSFPPLEPHCSSPPTTSSASVVPPSDTAATCSRTPQSHASHCKPPESKTETVERKPVGGTTSTTIKFSHRGGGVFKEITIVRPICEEPPGDSTESSQRQSPDGSASQSNAAADVEPPSQGCATTTIVVPEPEPSPKCSPAVPHAASDTESANRSPGGATTPSKKIDSEINSLQDQMEPPQKRVLFSLNPLGVPVKYLNPQPPVGRKLQPTWPQNQCNCPLGKRKRT